MPTLDEVVRSFHHHFFAISIAGVTRSCGVAGPSSKRREWWQFQTQRSCSAVVSSTNCSALTCLHEIPVWVIFSSQHQGRKCWYPPRLCSVLYPKMRRDDRGFVCSKTSRCYNLFPMSSPETKMIQDSNRTAKSFPCHRSWSLYSTKQKRPLVS